MIINISHLVTTRVTTKHTGYTACRLYIKAAASATTTTTSVATVASGSVQAYIQHGHHGGNFSIDEITLNQTSLIAGGKSTGLAGYRVDWRRCIGVSTHAQWRW